MPHRFISRALASDTGSFLFSAIAILQSSFEQVGSDVLFVLGLVTALVTLATRIGDVAIRWRALYREEKQRQQSAEATRQIISEIESGGVVAFDEFCADLQRLESATVYSPRLTRVKRVVGLIARVLPQTRKFFDAAVLCYLTYSTLTPLSVY